ncbi:peroxiredoxin [Sphingomonas sp. TREG-RG-20F-R18-01]|uniref:peroxiredoxin n=1 Tax=Sphingomonas sp. TREG-RG-20F-R18-01 TaxID=2914982 RepID=UPI001F58DBC0|nr:peroxiredoxin [Sphingomonas sp. TREG-RG-20F-R18-01]
MTALAEGGMIPAVDLCASDGSRIDLRGYVGKPLVLYFYPKDDTPGCTREAQDFSAAYEDFRALGTAVLGVSRDTAEKHRKFAAKHDLIVPLASDDTETALEPFGAWVEKTLYGRTYMGIDRSTFLFDADGILVRVWRKVRVPGHVDQVLDAVRTLS